MRLSATESHTPSPLRHKRWSRAAWGASFSAAALLAALSLHARGPDDDYRLSNLRVFNRVVLLVKEQYVEPDRIKPREMLLAALDAVEKSVPEVLVEEPVNGSGNTQFTVVVGADRKVFTLDDVGSPWELSFKLREVFRFLEARVSSDVDRREIEYAATNGMLSKLDPHSVLLEPKFSQEMKLNTKGEFGGLGIVISVRDGALTVISPIDDTPADRAGVKAQDKIVKIGEESTVNMGLDEAVERLRGKPGTTVVVWIARKGWDEPQRFDIVRAKIKVDSVTHQLLEPQALRADGKPAKGKDVVAWAQTKPFGYVKVKQFQGNTAEDVFAAVSAMQKEARTKLGGLVLDLRNNPGGLLDQAIELSNLFLPDGVLVVTQEGGSGGERREVRADARKARLDLPVVVLVNGGSASASEIVAGALKNRGRGVIIGDQTFGKGSVQQLYDFPDGSSLKLTISQYLTPGDESIQSVGIVPDVRLTPIWADAIDRVNVFPDTHMREEDLEAHLNDARTQKRESVYALAYLGETLDDAEQERRQASTKFQEDFEIQLSRRLLEAAPQVTRDGMLTSMRSAVDQVNVEQEKKIDEALFKLGVDWSRGPTSAAQRIEARIVEASPAPAGGKFKLTIEAKNVGPTPVHRLRGITQSTLGLYADRELLFGKLAPGEAKTWTLDVPLPKELPSRRDLVRIAFSDDQRELTQLDVPVTSQGLARARFAYAMFIDDARSGNGDGLLQSGESVDLVVNVKNTGTGTSEEPTALLKNLGGAETFIETGRQKLAALKPGASAVARFSFKVQPPGASEEPAASPSPISAAMKPNNDIELRMQIFDGVTGDMLVEKLTFALKAPAEAKKKRAVVEAAAKTTVLAAAEATAPVLGIAESGTRFDAVSEVNGFTRVKLGNLFGYVATNEVGPSRGKLATTASGEPKGLSLVFGRDPPRITFAGARDGLVVVDSDRYTVDATIEDDTPVIDAYLFVGDQKVRYLATPRPKPGDNKLAEPRMVMKHEVQLKPGANVITLVAREDEEFAQRESLTVYSTKGDPLADPKNR